MKVTKTHTGSKLRSYIRSVFVAVFLLPPISIGLSTSSCNCSKKCEKRSVAFACYELSVSECAQESVCVVGAACDCSGSSFANSESTRCDTITCYRATTQSECLKVPSCEWGAACQDAVDCGALQSEDACYNTPNARCEWMEDGCGGG